MITLQASKLYSDEYGPDERIQFSTVPCNFDYRSPGGSALIRTSICFTIGISINLICSMIHVPHLSRQGNGVLLYEIISHLAFMQRAQAR